MSSSSDEHTIQDLLLDSGATRHFGGRVPTEQALLPEPVQVHTAQGITTFEAATQLPNSQLSTTLQAMYAPGAPDAAR